MQARNDKVIPRRLGALIWDLTPASAGVCLSPLLCLLSGALPDRPPPPPSHALTTAVFPLISTGC